MLNWYWYFYKLHTKVLLTPFQELSSLMLKHSQFGNLRTLTIDNEPWFVGKDVAEALGYSNGRDALSRHVSDEDKTSVVIPDSGSNYKSKATIINESGLYSLILGSKLPTAKQFKHWVTAFLSLAYIPALCIHIQSRIDSVYFSISFSTCQYKMDHRAKYEVNCCLFRIKSKKRLIWCGFCRSINCVIFKHNYYLTCYFCSKIVMNFNSA